MANKSVFFTDGKGGIYKIEKLVRAAVLVNLETQARVTAEMLGSQVSGFAMIKMPATEEITVLPADTSEAPTPEKKPRKKRKSKSGYYGVSAVPNSKKNPWRAVIFIEGKRINIGGFPTDVAAAKAVDAKLIEMGKPPRNFPQARTEG